ncbi:putative C-_U-editing enzyme APOBEC-4 [Bufo gargarizans]|uniref:putative C->U-editing enzyme APOBEC-4 n=1 Tax=Bufo gargarizans TaxID=30331 RepID=UPI001CF3841E|nr:putative C->U-editing enzyme APOBEC-4 [Bufo gargarizans]
METIFQEFSGYNGTLVKPYYWLYPNHNCVKCPYHIRTGEDSRVTYGEFYEAFGFPYGPTMPENKHLIFYEIKAFNGAVIQRGQATNCTYSNLHAESMLFESQGYLDSFLHQHSPVGYLTLYANFTPCNEYGHYCISKIYDLLIRYPDLRLDIYFSQFYHVAEEFPTSFWNKEALKSLAGHWPRVTLNPLSNGVWKTVLYAFVKEVPENTLYQPILPARASADSCNAHTIHFITGIKPYFVDAPPVSQHQETKSLPESRRDKKIPPFFPLPQNSFFQHYPTLASRLPFMPASHGPKEVSLKPKHIVRHLNMPTGKSEEMNLSNVVPHERKVNEVVITEQVVKEKNKEAKIHRRKKNTDSETKSKR